MIQIGQPNPTIDTPIEHLTACHRRIEERLATLERAGDHLRQDRGAALDAIRSSIRFLDSSGALHTMDEEASLFPRLRPQLSREELAYVDSLEEQHDEAESVFADLKDVAAQLTTTSGNAAVLEGRYRQLTSRLGSLYRSHIRSEDEILSKLARRLIDPDQLKAISEEMRSRRAKK